MRHIVLLFMVPDELDARFAHYNVELLITPRSLYCTRHALKNLGSPRVLRFISDGCLDFSAARLVIFIIASFSKLAA